MSARQTKRGAVAPTAPDAELLNACTAFHRLHARWIGPMRSDDHSTRLCREWNQAIENVADLRPSTPLGVKARAGVAHTAFKWSVLAMADTPLEKQTNRYEWLAINALEDVAGAPETDAADAMLIRTCEQHIVNIRAFNKSSAMEQRDYDFDADPLWLAYSKTRDAISAAKPKTMAGVFAVAKAAMTENAENGGKEPEFSGMDTQWAWAVMRDLLRLHGEL